MITLKPRSLICHDRVSRRVGFVKCILRKIYHLIVDLIGNRFQYPVGDTARNSFGGIPVHEALPLPAHDFALLLGHSAAQKIASSKGISCQIAHDLHDLLLIDDTTVSRRKDRL